MSGSTVSFAFVAGTVATVTPCGFALLPAYLARRSGVEDGTRRSADAVSGAPLVGGVTSCAGVSHGPSLRRNRDLSSTADVN